MKKVAILSIILFAVATVASAQPVVVEKYWERLCGVDTATDNVRNMAVWPGDATMPVEALATIHRGAAADAIKLYNPQSGLRNVRNETLDMGSISSGTYNILAGDFSDEGSFYAANLAHSSPMILHVYRWATVDATPVEIYNSGSFLGYRMGDSLDVEGAESDNSVKIIVSGNNALSQPLVLTTADNGASFSASSLTNAVRAQDIDLLSDGTFWATYSGGVITKYNADGTAAGSSLTGTEARSAFAVDETKGWIYTMGYYTSDSVLEVYDIASDALLYSATPDTIDVGGFASGTANGSAAVEIVEAASGTYIYAMSERNGVARYSVSSVLTVDGVGAGAYEYATIQGAIDSYCADGANASVTTTPLIIEVDPAGGPYTEHLCLDDSQIGDGDIAGSLVIKSASVAKAVIKLGTAINSTQGITLHENAADTIFKNLIFCPAITGATVSGTYLIKVDENGGNDIFNWTEFWDCVLTDVDEAGDPFATDKASALVQPATSGGGFNRLISSWDDPGESHSVLADNTVFVGSGSYGVGLVMDGQGGEQVYVNNCMVANNPGYSVLRIGSRGDAAQYMRITGTDAKSGYANCTYVDSNNGHGIYIYCAQDGVMFIDNMVIDANSADSRAIAGTSWCDTAIQDSILNVSGGGGLAAIVEGLSNYAQYPAYWRGVTVNSYGTGRCLYLVTNSQSLEITDCIISNNGTTNAFGTWDPVNVTYSDLYCGISNNLGGTFASNCLYVDPLYINDDDPSAASFMDVQNEYLATASSTSGGLGGGADYIGGLTGYDIAINEIRIDQGGTDYDEFFELAGDPGTALDGFTYIVLGDGTGGSGVIEAVVPLDGLSIPADGYFAAAEDTMVIAATTTIDLVSPSNYINFENSENFTHILVEAFTGSDDQDLDTDDDGVLDVEPWGRIVDIVGLIEEATTPPTGTEWCYSPVTVGPDGTYTPGHVFRLPDRTGAWQIGNFTAGASDTPGISNWNTQAAPIVGGATIAIGEVVAGTSSLTFQADCGDLLDGVLADRFSGGFHSAVSSDADKEAAFTDCIYWTSSNLSGLLNDFPGQNTPAWSGCFAVSPATDIAEIHVFSGNLNSPAGARTFHHYDVYATNDPNPTVGSPWTLVLAEVIPAPFGSTNVADNHAALTVLRHTDGTSAFAEDVTALRFDFYAVGNTANRFDDDWDNGVGDDRDGFAAAVESSLIIEVDAFDEAQSASVNGWVNY